VIPALYAIVDAEVAGRHGWTVPALARAYLHGGARLIQVRAKKWGSAALLAAVEEVLTDARTYDALVIVNDRADIAALAGADGVHVGQEDLRIREIRRAFPDVRLVGLSTHTTSQVDAAVGQQAGYIAVGPVFGTRTKDTGYDAVGLDLVRYGRAAVGATAGAGVSPAGASPSLVAIGGITLERAPEVLAAGASSVAIISDLLATGDPVTRVRAYVERLT